MGGGTASDRLKGRKSEVYEGEGGSRIMDERESRWVAERGVLGQSYRRGALAVGRRTTGRLSRLRSRHIIARRACLVFGRGAGIPRSAESVLVRLRAQGISSV